MYRDVFSSPTVPVRRIIVGNAFAMFTSLNVILGILPEAQTGAGSALTRTLQQLAASFGVAILGSILNNAYRTELADQLTVLPARLKVVAEGSVAEATLMAATCRLPSASIFFTLPTMLIRLG